MRLVSRRGFSAVSYIEGIADPATAWDVLVYRREESRQREIREAMTGFALERIREEGGSFADVIVHLRSPSETREHQRQERLAEEERVIAYFKELQNRSRGVTISQIR